MLLTDYRNFLKNALTGVAPINGVYILYSTSSGTALPAISADDTLATITSAVEYDASNLGLARVPNIAAGITDSSIRLIGTTANGHTTAGSPLEAGMYVRAIMAANLTGAYNSSNPGTSDDILDYNEINAIVIPANGNVTLIDEVVL